ncbi:TOPRIM nucleotidyl transferase/hydrolase domain-containing protein, partial [Peteryoungia desertarenae]
KFLQQYMTLTKCDLYFADKAVLVEGATERILMPRIIKLIDGGDLLPPESKLGRQYVTIIEAGGAHAQVFYPLIEFLELKTLVIADLDAVKLVESKWRKCPCVEGERTSNSALKTWFNDKEISIEALIAKETADKTKRFCRIAYQIPEEGSTHCARSYEDALVLANLSDFGIPNDADAAKRAWEVAQDFRKSEEAIKYAIREQSWNVPKYIEEGLAWLAKPPPTIFSEGEMA